jgi:hypothetical protein
MIIRYSSGIFIRISITREMKYIPYIVRAPPITSKRGWQTRERSIQSSPSYHNLRQAEHHHIGGGAAREKVKHLWSPREQAGSSVITRHPESSYSLFWAQDAIN